MDERGQGHTDQKVRCYAPNVTRPLNIRKHRDISRHEYKRTGHFMNDGNYCIAIYEQDLPEGSTAKAKRSFRIVNNLAAASHFKLGNRANRAELYPSVDENGYRLKAVLHQGDSVLLYENRRRRYTMPPPPNFAVGCI